jgi:hypothetical protein
MWEARRQPVRGGTCIHIFQERSRLSFREFFALLEADPAFGQWYTDTLAATDLAAFFWEHPPLTNETFEDSVELVLIESAQLARLHADPEPFASHFVSHPEADIITFPNLSGDAVLVVPRPVGNIEAYSHLAAFLRSAPESQVLDLWKTTAQVVREGLSSTPMWLSTAGLGAAWLHLRLDTRPKYYTHGAYKRAV